MARLSLELDDKGLRDAIIYYCHHKLNIPKEQLCGSILTIEEHRETDYRGDTLKTTYSAILNLWPLDIPDEDII